MKTVIVLTLLIATVFCLPVKRSASSSESSEEMIAVQRPPSILKADANMFQEEPTQTTPGDSNESTNDTEEADEESETDEDEDEDETDSSESNSGETQSTIVPSTVEAPLDPVINTGRGDSMDYPSDYKKSIVYVDANNFEKQPSPYKSYSSDKLGDLTFVSKKMSAYDDQSFNDIEKEIQLHKALRVHDLLEEDTSTPEMENMEPGDRKAALGSQEIVPAGNQELDGEGASAGESATNSASASASASASQEGNEEESASSEETTATPGAADSESDSAQSTESQESDSDEENTQTTEASVINAK